MLVQSLFNSLMFDHLIHTSAEEIGIRFMNRQLLLFNRLRFCEGVGNILEKIYLLNLIGT